MIRSSDIIIPEFAENRILISKHEYYGPNSARVKRYAKLISDAVEVIKTHKLIKINPKLILRIGIDDRDFQGLHHDKWNVVEVKPISDRAYFLQLVCHEMIHSEQYYTGIYERTHPLCDYGIWKGKRYKFPDFKNIKKMKNGLEIYERQPWERDAYNRQGEIACEVMGLIKEKENANR
jgi:hypothetical protein